MPSYEDVVETPAKKRKTLTPSTGHKKKKSNGTKNKNLPDKLITPIIYWNKDARTYEVRYECWVCTKHYASTGNLRRHEGYECGKEPSFICGYNGCEVKFQHKHSCKLHRAGAHKIQVNDDGESFTVVLDAKSQADYLKLERELAMQTKVDMTKLSPKKDNKWNIQVIPIPEVEELVREISAMDQMERLSVNVLQRVLATNNRATQIGNDRKKLNNQEPGLFLEEVPLAREDPSFLPYNPTYLGEQPVPKNKKGPKAKKGGSSKRGTKRPLQSAIHPPQPIPTIPSPQALQSLHAIQNSQLLQTSHILQAIQQNPLQAMQASQQFIQSLQASQPPQPPQHPQSENTATAELEIQVRNYRTNSGNFQEMNGDGDGDEIHLQL